ncbi:hypothetical protein [Paenibacillus sp. CAA11]|uniref:hypothetical protein n=1 Tax=Paenibacillus sp. CAA11 TaxID=1532905 RepID=UPI00131EF82A|nr:hypothetical protein [Paenibacillus sp. CAA11]
MTNGSRVPAGYAKYLGYPNKVLREVWLQRHYSFKNPLSIAATQALTNMVSSGTKNYYSILTITSSLRMSF